LDNSRYSTINNCYRLNLIEMAKTHDKSRTSNNNKKKKNEKNHSATGNSKSQTTKKSFYTKRKKELTFDPDARKEFLCGFSDRKRQRRAFGLAMQKVKDRQAKLDERKETRSAVLERVEEAERAKDLIQQVRLDKQNNPQQRDNDDDNDEEPAASMNVITTTYQDDQTKQQWGGQVIVTTSVMPLSEEEDDDQIILHPTKKQLASIDQDQRYAGNVHHFLGKLKNKLPAKGKSAHATKVKGKHGAANMKGMGGAANLKMAQKVLSKFSSKSTEAKTKGKGKRR
jgi:ribosomal RNA-processing protein 17